MKNLLIGSRALAHWEPSLKIKDSTDYDVISVLPIEGTEHHSYDKLLNSDIEQFASDDFITLNGSKIYIVNMVGLTIIKRSHLWRTLNFQKHITHYHKYGLHKCYLDISFRDFMVFIKREKATKEAFPTKSPILTITKYEFFNDGIYRRYDHDLLHELVSYDEDPAYKKLQEEGDEVMCRLDKWLQLSYEDRLQCATEEVYVTMLERFILIDNPLPYKLAFIKALDKTCTTMTSGWFRTFAISNYHNIHSKFDKNKIEKVLEVLGE